MVLVVSFRKLLVGHVAVRSVVTGVVVVKHGRVTSGRVVSLVLGDDGVGTVVLESLNSVFGGCGLADRSLNLRDGGDRDCTWSCSLVGRSSRGGADLIDLVLPGCRILGYWRGHRKAEKAGEDGRLGEHPESFVVVVKKVSECVVLGGCVLEECLRTRVLLSSE